MKVKSIITLIRFLLLYILIQSLKRLIVTFLFVTHDPTNGTYTYFSILRTTHLRKDWH